jgi:hypothetical protein
LNLEDLEFKIPVESPEYAAWSEFVTEQISSIIRKAITEGNNKIFIHTNLKRGLPLENINKVAGPFVEAWAVEQFEMIADDPANPYKLIKVEAGARLDPYDVILQFKKAETSTGYISSDVDVKATSENIASSGKSPNVTSYARIRTEYLEDPDYIFILLSIKHKVYGEKDPNTGMTNGIMEVRSFGVYDLKWISTKDIRYNPALGTGQLQIKDINYVAIERKTAWEFCQMLDEKYIRSKGIDAFRAAAQKYGWVK